MHKNVDSKNERARGRYYEGLALLKAFRGSRDWNELSQAEQSLAEAAALDRDYNAARFYLGVVQEVFGKHEQAAKQFEMLLGRVPANTNPDPELLYNLGLSYFHHYETTAYEKALKYLERLLSELPVEQTNKTSDATRFRKTESIRLLVESLVAQIYSHLSMTPPGKTEAEYGVTAKKNCEQAVEIAKRALKEFDLQRDKLDAEIVTDIGWSLHNAVGHARLYSARRNKSPQEFTESINELTEALNFDPENYRVLSNLGSAEMYFGELFRNEKPPDEAVVATHLNASEKYFQKVLQIKEHYDFAYYRLARIAMLRKKTDEAKAMLKLAREHPSEMTAANLNRLETEINS